MNPTIKDVRRFEKKYILEPNTGCWLWVAHCLPQGYGVFVFNGKNRRSHRFSYELHIGPIPEGLDCLHVCDTPRCCNPVHLFLGTNEDNVRDKVKKGRHSRGSKHGASKLTEAQVIEIRSRVGQSHIELAREFGIRYQNIGAILNRKHWGHI
jgi:hypothetical protein